MTTHAETLIAAVQSGDPSQVRAVLAHLQRLAEKAIRRLPAKERQWARRSYVDSRLPGPLGLTALHVAAKAYGAYRHDPNQAQAFDAMVADLLAAGACPWVEVGARGARVLANGECIFVASHGRTVVEECQGRLPPSLMRWIAEHCDDRGSSKADAPVLHPLTRARIAERTQAWRERRQAREALAS